MFPSLCGRSQTRRERLDHPPIHNIPDASTESGRVNPWISYADVARWEYQWNQQVGRSLRQDSVQNSSSSEDMKELKSI